MYLIQNSSSIAYVIEAVFLSISLNLDVFLSVQEFWGLLLFTWDIDCIVNVPTFVFDLR